MAAGSTYTPIATQTVSGSSTATVTFSSIAGTYTDLIIVANGYLTSADNTYIQFNGSSAGYSGTYLKTDGTTVTSSHYSGNNVIVTDATSYPNTTGGSWTAIIHILNYANASTTKPVLIRSGNAAIGLSATVHLWGTTAAITSIALLTQGPKWGDGTTFTLYGITSA